MSPTPEPPAQMNGVPCSTANGFSTIATSSLTAPASDANPIPAWAGPDLTRLVCVHKSAAAFGSSATSLVSLPAGALFARITSATVATKAYSTVQVSGTQHIELNSDLLYANHSCAPSLEFDMQRWEIRVSRDRALRVGDPLTFFYPSTEWEMAQAFQCGCGAGARCRGWIRGARDMGRAGLQGYWVNQHVLELLKEEEGR